MTKLYEVLAAEATAIAAADRSVAETLAKFHKSDSYFRGMIRNLELIEDSPSKAAQESAESSIKAVATSAGETLKYTLDLWAKAEDVRSTKNATNQNSRADLVLEDGTVVAKNVPVDELMGLEVRTIALKKLLSEIPTLDASKEFSPSTKWPVPGLFETAPKQTIKTEKVPGSFIMAPATDKFPAQVKETVTTKVIGTFTDVDFSSAMTTDKKATLMVRADSLIVAARKARNRANDIDIVDSKTGTAVIEFLMKDI